MITLGTLYIYRGVVLSWAGSNRINASDLPDAFGNLGTQTILSIPVLFLVALLVVVVVGYYLHTARGGRELYAIGSDPDAAVLYGLDVRRRVVSAFVLSGALAGLAGVVFAARYGTRQLREPAPASSSRPWPPSSSAASRSSAAAAPSGGPRSARCSWSPSTGCCRSSASPTSGSRRSSAP